MKKSASACLLMVSAFAVQDELFVLAAAAVLSGLFAAISLSLLRAFFRHGSGLSAANWQRWFVWRFFWRGCRANMRR